MDIKSRIKKLIIKAELSLINQKLEQANISNSSARKLLQDCNCEDKEKLKLKEKLERQQNEITLLMGKSLTNNS